VANAAAGSIGRRYPVANSSCRFPYPACLPRAEHTMRAGGLKGMCLAVCPANLGPIGRSSEQLHDRPKERAFGLTLLHEEAERLFARTSRNTWFGLLLGDGLCVHGSP